MIEGRLGVFVDTRFQAIGEQIDSRGVFVGCALDKFASTARDMFLIACDTGLQPGHQVLEIGAGCLRTGVWFIDFLHPGGYCGIEPNTRMLDAGRDLILRHQHQAREPSFDANTEFDFSVFGRKFDWVVGYSIWSHCSKDQITRSVRGAAEMQARLLFSFAPAHPRRPEYQGERWIGISHESSEKGIAYHHPDFLMSVCREYGLSPYIIPAVTGSQIWLYAEPMA